jgi:hypothetical protein
MALCQAPHTAQGSFLKTSDQMCLHRTVVYMYVQIFNIPHDVFILSTSVYTWVFISLRIAIQ